MSKIEPLFDYVLIEPLESETTLPSGILIPDSAKKKSQEGKVIEVGPGKKDEKGEIIPMFVKKNDVVMYKEWGGSEIKIKGKKHLLVKEEDLLAIVK